MSTLWACDHPFGDTTWCRQHGSPWPDQTDSPRCALALAEALAEAGDEGLAIAIHLLGEPLVKPATRQAMGVDDYTRELALLRLMEIGEGMLRGELVTA